MFAAIIEPKDQMLDSLLAGIPGVMPALPAATAVFCADLVDMLAEFRVYVVDGAVRAICQYRGAGGALAQLDEALVKQAVQTFAASAEGAHVRSGCAMDFAVVRDAGSGALTTCLVEVNDGFSLGRYAGVSGRDYTDLLVARWAELMRSGK